MQDPVSNVRIEAPEADASGTHEESREADAQRGEKHKPTDASLRFGLYCLAALRPLLPRCAFGLRLMIVPRSRGTPPPSGGTGGRRTARRKAQTA